MLGTPTAIVSSANWTMVTRPQITGSTEIKRGEGAMRQRIRGKGICMNNPRSLRSTNAIDKGFSSPCTVGNDSVSYLIHYLLHCTTHIVAIAVF